MTDQSPSFETILFASAAASAHFALSCLEPYNGRLRARSSFVTPTGEVMHWHDFGDLEGPGWAANTVGGAHLLYRWGRYTGDAEIQAQALALLDHVLEDGFIAESGFIWPYYDLTQGRFCLNYMHKDDWLCPGSLAKIGVQLLEFADAFLQPPNSKLVTTAQHLAAWLHGHTPSLPNGWVPRRITLEGRPFPLTPHGQPDPIFDHSADGLFLLQLYAALTSRGLADYRAEATTLGDAFMAAGGFWGSINHDTYDDHENVAYSVAFRVLRQAAGWLDRPAWREFACQVALPGLERFRMHEDRNGVPTAGLLWMEETWNTAYLWENAEAALALLEAWDETSPIPPGLAILRAIANHHTGALGFLTEGVDWDNHVTRKHHVREALYGDIQYTEPLLNNLHLLAPTLFYLDKIGYRPPADLDDRAAIARVNELGAAANPPISGADGVRYLLRLYHPAIATDAKLEQALRFAQAARVDGVLLFESSYDMDPALLTMDVLRERFARLKAVVPRFRAIVPEVHINVMITIGHVDAGSGRPERFPFQFMVDEGGQVSRSSACPLDPAFREYVRELYGLAAERRADVVWVDDDYRLILHDTPGLTCFCPQHLAAMSRRTGRAWTRETLVAALADDPATRRAWLDLQEEAMLDLARLIEQTIHQVNPAMRIGLMTIGTAYHAAEGRRTDRLLRTLSGPTRPLIRPGSGFYCDWTPGGGLDKSEDCARQISLVGADVQGVAEVENHPYTPFSKSERVLALELALDVLAGMPDLSLNLLSSMGGAEPVAPEGTDFVAFLRRERPFLDALARAWAGRVRRGIGIACSEDYARHLAVGANPRGRPSGQAQGLPLRDAWIERRPWETLLARAGFPIGRPDQAPHWLAGEVVRALPDGELAGYLREGAVLDPLAAKALLDRGWGDRLGLADVRPVNDGVNELLTADPLNGPRAGHILPAYNHVPPEMLYAYDVKVTGTEVTGTSKVPVTCRVLSRWLNVDGQDRGPAAVALTTPDGWQIALQPYALQAPNVALLSLARREQWAALLGWAAAPLTGVRNSGLPCRVVQGVNLYPLAFVDLEAGSWLLAVANLAADDAKNAEVELFGPLDDSWQVERLDRRGRWRPVAGPVDRRLRLDVPAFSLVAYRLSCGRPNAQH